ncbi:unnamed protein product [Auanema sp. JU1783]|nr:unnamed protein product [Auanema sp. JU1783]
MSALNEADSTVILDVIEMKNDPNWKLQRLKDELSQMCWQYTKSEALIRNYNGEKYGTNIVWAHIVQFVTPIDMRVRPIFATRIYHKLLIKLEDFARNNTLQFFERDQLIESVPCLAYANHRFFRGKIVRVSNKESVEVENVDNGGRFLLAKEKLRPLPMKFGRIPPLSLKCFLNGTKLFLKFKKFHSKDAGACVLDPKKVMLFRKQISDGNDLVRIEFCSNEEPFRVKFRRVRLLLSLCLQVNVLHPTILNNNLAEIFSQRAFKVGEEMCTSETRREPEEDKYGTTLKFKKFLRLPRRSLEYYVSHIENAQEIFLKTETMKRSTMKIENFINLHWDAFDEYDTIKRERAVLIRTCSETYHRASMNPQSSFLLIDHGKTLPPGVVMQIRNIPSNWLLSAAPGVYKALLTGRSKYPPHYSETKILRELLPTGVKVYFNCSTRDSASEGNLESENYKDLISTLDERLLEARINPSCLEVLPYNNRTNR